MLEKNSPQSFRSAINRIRKSGRSVARESISMPEAVDFIRAAGAAVGSPNPAMRGCARNVSPARQIAGARTEATAGKKSDVRHGCRFDLLIIGKGPYSAGYARTCPLPMPIHL